MSAFADVKTLLDRLETHPGASAAELLMLPTLAPRSWPDDYLDCLRWSNGFEGYVGGSGYLWLWSAHDVDRLNHAYAVHDLAPGVVLIGSDAAALGYGFDLEAPDMPVVSIEMAAMHREYLTVCAQSFSAFVNSLAVAPLPEGVAQPEDHRPPEWLRGKIIHEKHRIVLGGKPNDPDNRVLVPRDEHPRLTVFFAKVLHSVRAQSLEERRRRTRS